MSEFNNVSVVKKANVYFGGNVSSHLKEYIYAGKNDCELSLIYLKQDFHQTHSPHTLLRATT